MWLRHAVIQNEPLLRRRSTNPNLSVTPAPLHIARHPRGGSIYVAAASSAAYDQARSEAEQEAGPGSGTGSGASSPRSTATTGASRTLRPPWSLGHLPPASPDLPLGEHLTSLEQLNEGRGQLASLLQASGASEEDGGLAARVGALHLSEEEALQRALELSLQEARQQQGQQGSADVQVAAAQGRQQQQDVVDGSGGGALPLDE